MTMTLFRVLTNLNEDSHYNDVTNKISLIFTVTEPDPTNSTSVIVVGTARVELPASFTPITPE